MKWIADPSHAWLKVSLKKNPDAIKFSTGFGYISPKGDYVYLEEDCEAPAYLRAKGIDSMSLPEQVYGKTLAPLRKYAHAPRVADFDVKNGGIAQLEEIATGEILVSWKVGA